MAPTIAPSNEVFFPAVCGATSLVGKDGQAVKQHTDGTIILSSAQGERHLYLVKGAAVGHGVTLAGAGCKVPVIVDEAIATYLTELTSAGNGKFEAAASGDWVSALNLELSTADGDFIYALLIGGYTKA